MCEWKDCVLEFEEYLCRRTSLEAGSPLAKFQIVDPDTMEDDPGDCLSGRLMAYGLRVNLFPRSEI